MTYQRVIPLSVESLLETPTGLKLGGEKCTLTILMADLRGFTSMSERLPPEDVVSIINTGEVVENIGGKKRAKYGVVGLNVNLTSRASNPLP
jgi:class 3 adenylate cyclase